MILDRLSRHEYLSRTEARDILTGITAEKYNPFQIASFITVFRMRGITVEELAGFREALMALCIRLEVGDFQTIVIYMGLIGLGPTCRALITAGKRADTPVALVERGTTPQQRSHIGTLETIEQIVADRDVHAPTLIIIGSVVSLHQQLGWFDGADNPVSQS